jgi:hypothetical protein
MASIALAFIVRELAGEGMGSPTATERRAA